MGASCNQAVKMFLRISILFMIFQFVVSDIMSYSKTVRVTNSGVTKTATCDITVSYSGNQIDSSSSSISCSINWPKNKALDKKNIQIPVVLGSLGNLFVVNVKFELFKKKSKPSGTTKTNNPSFVKQDVDVDNGDATNPVDIWCPGENKIIWTPGYNVVNESSQNSWQDCAQLCATFINEAENVYGLAAGACRLLPYSPVFRMEANGVQSGYWKCWKAYSTSQSP